MIFLLFYYRPERAMALTSLASTWSASNWRMMKTQQVFGSRSADEDARCLSFRRISFS